MTFLENHADVFSGYAWKAKHFNDGPPGLPIVRIQNLGENENEQFVYWRDNFDDRFKVKNNDLLVSLSGSFKVALWNGGDALLNQRIVRVTPKANVLKDWLYFVLRNRLTTISSMGRKMSVSNVSIRDLKRLPIDPPPLDEQRRIVDILNHASSIRRLREQAQAKAREIIPALFLDMFGDPATNPKGWEVRTVGDILSSAQYGTSTKASETQAGIPMLRMGNVTTDGALSLAAMKYVVLEDGETEKYALRVGDILFNRTNSKELVGKTGLWDGRFPAVHASYFIRLRVEPKQAHPAFVWAFFNTGFMKQRLFETARGAIGQANINAKEVRSFPIPVPPIMLQEKFYERLEDVKAMIKIGERAGDAANVAFLALLYSCFSESEAQL